MDAIIFGGAVAKGAFGAGAFAVLAEAGLRIGRVVGTSSGALNAAYVASAVRSGRERTAGDELARIWVEEGNVSHAFDVSLRGIIDFEGVSTSDKLIALQREHLHPSTAKHPIELRIVVTDSSGLVGGLDAQRQGTTYERVLRYTGETFDSKVGLESLFAGVAASSAFPGAFVPFPLSVPSSTDGAFQVTVPCFDGGLTDNTPVKQAIDDAPEIDRVFVIAPSPAVLDPTPPPRGIALIAHLVDILVQERLYRDLRRAHAINATLARLEAAIPDPVARAAALEAFGWSDRRKLEIVEIRPQTALEGGPFDGLLSKRLREGYVASGRAVAQEWIDSSRDDQGALSSEM